MSSRKVKLESIIEDTRWLELDFDIKAHSSFIVEKILSFIDFFNYAKTAKITVKFSNDADLKKLNSDFRNKNHETNVLSFPTLHLKEADFELHKLPKDVYLGDIAISFDSVITESLEQGKTFYEHFTHLIVHSILHLLGFDHLVEEEATKMEDLEIEILNKMNIKNPYII